MKVHTTHCIVQVLVATMATGTAAFAGDNVKTKELWSVGDNGYETYRIPGVVASARGTIIAYTTARRTVDQGDWGDSVVVMRRSLDKGKNWDKSKVVAGDGHGITDNGVAIASKDGKVHFLYQHNYDHVFYEVSGDDGVTFSQPVDITAALEDLRPAYPWNVVALGPGHAIELKNGRLLVPVWLADGKAFPNGTRQHQPTGVISLYSDDGGKTWHHGELFAQSEPGFMGPNELEFVQLADGLVMANIRMGELKKRRTVSVSPDGISRWTKLQYDEMLFDPICEASIVRYSEKPHDKENILLFSNPNSEDSPYSGHEGWGLRRNLTVRASEDEGKTWSVKRVLDMDPSGYSDLAVGSDKMIYDVYEAPPQKGTKPESVYVAIFNLAWLMKGDK